MNTNQSLAEALRTRADFLKDKSSTFLECGWGETRNVVAVLYEFADVVDSWSGEYLSKELTYEENQRRRYSATHSSLQKPMTIEERRAATAAQRSFDQITQKHR
jgi:hypothetical protein